MDAGEPADVFRAVVIGVAPSWSRRSNRAFHRWAVRRRRSGGQLKVRGGLGPRSGAARQTTTGTNALEVDMPPRHQGYTLGEDADGGHVANCAMDTDICPNRDRFALSVSKSRRGRGERSVPLEISAIYRAVRNVRRKGRVSRVWETGCMTVRTALMELPHLVAVPGRPFGIYIHVPFCATRCGYCDFNTYTPAELGGANPYGWLEALRAELGLAAARLGAVPDVSTVFVGGGTPSLLGADGLAEVLDAVRDHFTLAPGAEVTTESNPES